MTEEEQDLNDENRELRAQLVKVREERDALKAEMAAKVEVVYADLGSQFITLSPDTCRRDKSPRYKSIAEINYVHAQELARRLDRTVIERDALQAEVKTLKSSCQVCDVAVTAMREGCDDALAATKGMK